MRSGPPLGPEHLVEITGNDALTGFTAPKLLWVRDHEPDAWARVAHVLLPKDYVRYRLTGEFALDKADGAGTILFDLAARDWSAGGPRRARHRPGVDAADPRGSRDHRDRHARRPPPPRASGRARPSSPAAATRRRTPWASGRSCPGASPSRSARRASCSRRPTGPSSMPAGRVHAFCHAVPGRWHLMSVMLSAAGSLRWFRDAIAPGEPFDRPGGRRRVRARGERRPAVPPVPDRRALPVPGSARARRVRRA